MKFNQLPSFLQYLYQTKASLGFLLVLSKEEGEENFILNELFGASQPAVKMREGDGLTAEEFFNECEPGFFSASTDVLVVNHAEKLKSAVIKEIHKELTSSKSLKHNVLIFFASGLRSDHLLVDAFHQSGHILDMTAEKPAEKEYRLAQWVQKSFQEGSKTAPFEVCSYLVKQVGTDSSMLKNEVDKLICFAGDRSEISTADIQQLSPKVNRETIWQWGEAVLKRDKKAALRIGRALLADGQAFIPLLKILRGQLQTAFQVAILSQRPGSAAEIQRTFPYMKGRLLDHHLALARGYGEQQLKHSLLLIDQMDLSLRNGMDDVSLLMDLLIFKITDHRK
jgi:DNA polymerase-3 subunit delta